MKYGDWHSTKACSCPRFMCTRIIGNKTCLSTAHFCYMVGKCGYAVHFVSYICRFWLPIVLPGEETQQKEAVVMQTQLLQLHCLEGAA